MTIGDRIKARRTELGLSQREFAARLGYKDHTTLTRIENNKVDLPQSRLEKIADLLGVTPGFLLGWEDQPEEAGELAAQVLKDPSLLRLVSDYMRLSPEDRETVCRLTASLANKKD
jgi:transcriptional regulator with XRE-family HTH domain